MITLAYFFFRDFYWYILTIQDVFIILSIEIALIALVQSFDN